MKKLIAVNTAKAMQGITIRPIKRLTNDFMTSKFLVINVI